jgi:hypothetical protein
MTHEYSQKGNINARITKSKIHRPASIATQTASENTADLNHVHTKPVFNP